MKYIYILIAVALAAFLSFFLLPKLVIAEDKYPEGWCADTDAVCFINRYATLFGSNEDHLYSVMMAESKGKWVCGDRGYSCGQFAYFQETWNRYSRKYRETFSVTDQFDIKSLHDQVKLTSWVFSLEEVNKNEWTTYRALVRGGSYTFYSKFHQQWFTVKCPFRKLPI